MKIVLDLQGCQSASRFRGIGRYSLALVKGVLRNRGNHSIKLLLNGLYANGLDDLRQRLQAEMPAEDIIVFDAEGPVAEFDTGNTARARLAELARERLIRSINPDVVLLTSLFEGFVDDAVTSVGLLGDGPFTAVTLYDLIPYLNPDPNWPAHYKNYYDLKIESLKRADLLLSISDYARLECIGALPEMDGRVVNMSSACDSMFTPGEFAPGELAALLDKFGIAQPFVMGAGNLESRKNFVQLVRAFASLPAGLRQNRQVVLVGGADKDKIAEIEALAAEVGLAPTQLHVLGHVTDHELLSLYRACELFVFPSLHEGFGLPPLEAMACGAVVLGSNATSVPEVIGREDAMFDPTSLSQLRELMIKALTDESFRQSLRASALVQAEKFSWDKTAQRALRAIEAGVAARHERGEQSSARELAQRSAAMPVGRPRLAMVSPLPPERTGIADYVSELLPTLGETYEITVISDQQEVLPGPAGEIFDVKPIAWFEENAGLFDRVAYQMGNSPFHVHMLDLMRRHPGVVVMHDFYNSALVLWMDVSGYEPEAMKRVLLRSHGYGALEHYAREGVQAAKLEWPCSLDVMSNALGVIVHSNYSRELARRWYGEAFTHKMSLVRQHRAPVDTTHRAEARRKLGLADDDFVVCAFGFMDFTKLNHTLLEAWDRSALVKDKHCKLIFVGGREESDYGLSIDETIGRSEGASRIRITGFVDHETFVDYLSVVDVAVQLRTCSRGETSRTVLDCLVHGASLIVNANGPMAEYPDDALIKLEDEFKTVDLVEALERLWRDASLRERLGKRAQEYIDDNHEPHKTSAGYAAAIERVYESRALRATARTARSFWQQFPPPAGLDRHDTQRATDLIASPVKPSIYLDISATARNDLKTGIERVARSMLRELLLAPPDGYAIVPVYLNQENGHWRVRKAHQYLSKQPGYEMVEPTDDVVVPAQGDALIALDLFSDGVAAAAKAGLYDYWRAAGAQIGFTVFDLLPITRPEFFPPWAHDMHKAYAATICANADMLFCISGHVRKDLMKWLADHHASQARKPVAHVTHLGADVNASFPTLGLPEGAQALLEQIEARPSFLMVGTIEPRKGHLQAVKSFERLWAAGVDVNLVIVGFEGWKSLPASDRRTIPATVDEIRSTSELGKRLFWLEGISDEYLERVYAASSCLLSPSEGEGYGLPLIEAAQHAIPIIARDIEVFREVAGDAAFYFEGMQASDLEQAIRAWLDLHAKGQTPDPRGLTWDTWAQSAQRLGRLIAEQLHQRA
ncbi:glycosyltransferase [Paraburkholderia terrae]|uniref:glycosyltransferase n=1 Tax=Paraburkholderia terrae TaxID=311230 RepID=UPI002061D45B|nr:glycosyltransferase [Paraburkholderia terrae]BDC39217.1 mannosyltransferase A [Paraburkholderia terrae]